MSQSAGLSHSPYVTWVLVTRRDERQISLGSDRDAPVRAVFCPCGTCLVEGVDGALGRGAVHCVRRAKGGKSKDRVE